MAPPLLNEATHPRTQQELEVVSSEPPFDALCRTARALFSVHWSLICIDGKAIHCTGLSGGHDIRKKRLAASFCEQLPFSKKALVVEDATHDLRFAKNPFVMGAPCFRFYAGAPLFIAPDIQAGTLCLIDTSARAFTNDQCRQLEDLAQIVSVHLQMQAAIRNASEKEALHRLLTENSTDTIVRGDLDGVRLYVSPAVRTLLGYEPEELIGNKASDSVHPDDAEEFRQLMRNVREGRLDLGQSEQRQRHKDGSWVWLEACIKLTRDEISGQPDGYVASVRDISRRKEAETRLEYIALHDPLTNLPNRTLLDERLKQEMSRSTRTKAGFALFCLDLDRFKLVNDQFGHEAGDTVLRTVAGRLRSAVRAEDTVARLGGDEFVVIQIADENQPASAIRLADRLIHAASEPIDFNGAPMSVGLSIGIAFGPVAGVDADGLLRAADDALYKAKKAGRNRYSIFNAAITP